MKCARCNFDGDLAEHAADTGWQHPVCIVCQRRSLSEHERQTCATCIARVRADLADIVQGYAELEPTGVQNLTLLGDGTMQRLFRQDEADSYLASAHPLARDGERTPKPIRDELLSDPLPVLPTLVSWEDFIREDRRAPKGQPDPTLTQVVDWLTTNLDARLEIAQTFPAFDEFASDVRRLRSAVQHAAGLADDPVRAPATCAECEAQLIRAYHPPTDDRKSGRRRKGTEAEGLSDYWLCPACGQTVGRADYGFRVLVTSQAVEWAPIALAAAVIDKPIGLLRVWATRGHIKTRRERGRTEVWLPDVRDRIGKAS